MEVSTDSEAFLKRALDYHISKLNSTSSPTVHKSKNLQLKLGSVPFAAHWKNKDGIYLGAVDWRPTGAGGKIKASYGDIRYFGHWNKLYNDAKSGSWSIVHTNGRMGTGKYRVNEKGKVIGTGTNGYGVKVEVSWGG